MKTSGSLPYRQGFTLLELSVVLVILGLIAGGLLVGQALIRSYEIKALVGEKESYVQAANLFRSKYAYLPGDFPEATDIWGQNTVCGGTDASVKATCNGDGRSGILGKTNLIQEYERLGFWQHMSNAGFLPKQYTGYRASGYAAGVNIPTSPNYTAASWAVMYLGSDWWNAFFQTEHGHVFLLGDIKNWNFETPSIKPADLLSIDAKFDDGFPATGQVGSMTGFGNPDCTLKADGSSPTTDTDLDAIYNAIGDNGKKSACTAVFRNLF